MGMVCVPKRNIPLGTIPLMNTYAGSKRHFHSNIIFKWYQVQDEDHRGLVFALYRIDNSYLPEMVTPCRNSLLSSKYF